MARRKSTAAWLGDLHRAGRTDREIAAATGRGESFIQKVRTGKKPGASLLPAARRLATAQRQRKTGTAKPLPNVAPSAPRRPQALRLPQKHADVTGRHTFHTAKRAGPQLIDRIAAAARDGKLVRLTTYWSEAIHYQRKGRRKVSHDVELPIWDEGVDAYDALGDLDDAGYHRDPVNALMVLALDGNPEWEELMAFQGWQLHTIGHDDTADVWEGDE